jgi:hypothetical protein
MKDLITLFLFLSVFLVLLWAYPNDKDDKSKFIRKLVETAADGASTITLFDYNEDEITTIDGIAWRADFS